MGPRGHGRQNRDGARRASRLAEGTLPARAKGSLKLVVLIAATLAAYGPAMRGGFVWDDDDHVRNNLTLRSVEGLKRIWFEPGATPQYYPLVHTTFWIEYRLWGPDPAGYHVVNVCLHVVNAVLVWRVLALLGLPGAWVAGMVFALHPVHVESVAWITERKNVLSGVFYLGAALVYLRGGGVGRREKGTASIIGSLVLFIGALLSKTVTCTLPAALLLVRWWKRGRLSRRDAVVLLPWLGVGAAFGLMTAWLEQHHVGAEGEEWDLTFVERFLVAGRALWFYAGKLLVPARLTFIYPRWAVDTSAAWQYLYILGGGGVIAAAALARRRLGAGPLVALLCFAGTLFPALGFFNVYPMRYSFVADHFQYLASIGMISLVVVVARQGTDRLGRSGRAAAPVLAVLILTMLGTLTWRQGRIYRSPETLWRDTLNKNPDAWIAHNNLGNLLGGQGKHEEAIWHYREALRIRPNDAQTHNNLAGVLMAMGRIEEAIGHCREAIRLKPDYAEAHCNLAVLLAGRGSVREAIEHYRRAIEMDARLVVAQNNLAWILATCPDAAVRDAREAVQLAERVAESCRWADAGVLDTLAAAYASAGQYDRAATTARRAHELAAAAGTESLAAEIRARIEMYIRHQPYRQQEPGRPDRHAP